MIQRLLPTSEVRTDPTRRVRYIRNVDKIENIPPAEREKLREVARKYVFRANDYYLDLIDWTDPNDPIRQLIIPRVEELNDWGKLDASNEQAVTVARGVQHKYPDTALLLCNEVCGAYCRYCFRKRLFMNENDEATNDVSAGIEYIAAHPEVRNVLLTGGDPLLMSTRRLVDVFRRLREIPHVEIIRIGSRMPVVLPMRITDKLVEMLGKHHPVWLNTHFNHPREFTSSSRAALKKLADAGVPLGNQTVLLAGVNDCPRVMKSLVHKLVFNRVRPYYLYQCDLSEGLSHFRTPVGKGIEIVENLIGHTTGFAVPTYVIDAPGGGGKIPVMPNYLVSWSTNKVVLRNYEGVITSYREPDSYERYFCDRDCARCRLTLKTEDAVERNAIGISKLLADYDETIALTPEENERLSRRNGDDVDE